MASLFNGVVGKTKTIDNMILDIKDDMVRSVSNRLAYLLILSNEQFGMVADKDQGQILVNRLLTALLSKFL